MKHTDDTATRRIHPSLVGTLDRNAFGNAFDLQGKPNVW